MAKDIPGILLPRALAWREQFKQIGWLSESKRGLELSGSTAALELIQRTIQEQQLPEYNAPHDPWVFAVRLGKETWKPWRLTIDGKYVFDGNYWRERKEVYLVASRCRFAVLNATAMQTMVIWYKDLEHWSYKKDGNELIVFLTTRHEKIVKRGGEVWGGYDWYGIRWMVKLSGAGLLDVATALTASDPVARLQAHQGIGAKMGRRMEFAALIGQFIEEIGSIAG